MKAAHDKPIKPYPLRLTVMFLIWGIIFFFGVPSIWHPFVRIGYILLLLVLFVGTAAWFARLHRITERDAWSRLNLAYLAAGVIGTWAGPTLSEYIHSRPFEGQGRSSQCFVFCGSSMLT